MPFIALSTPKGQPIAILGWYARRAIGVYGRAVGTFWCANDEYPGAT